MLNGSHPSRELAKKLMSIARPFARKWYRRLAGKTVVWTAEELYQRICNLSDDALKDLAACNIEVIMKMLELLPHTEQHAKDRLLLEWLLGQLKAFPSQRLCTQAAIECQRIRKTGVFDRQPLPKVAPKDTLRYTPME